MRTDHRARAVRERRRFRVTYGVDELRYVALTHDISSTGLFLVTRDLVPLATHIHMHVDSPTGTMDRDGVVARHQIVPGELRSVLANGMGVRFLAIHSRPALGVGAGIPYAHGPLSVECATAADLERFCADLATGFVMIRAGGAPPPVQTEAKFQVHVASAARPPLEGTGRVVQILDVAGEPHAVLEVPHAAELRSRLLGRPA
ncbi:MAG: PilZ domain-containing protein [Deltaproteobacteria bacterium]|nr:PilZ domain-containing protein [Deltaproteobacteria bacterium]